MSGAFFSGHPQRFGEPERYIKPDCGRAAMQALRFTRETLA